MKIIVSIMPKIFTTTVFLTLLLASESVSQYSVTNQKITLQVVELNALTVTSRLVSFVSSMVRPETPSATTRLVWTSNGEDKKITVACRAAHTTHALRIAVRTRDRAQDNLELADSATIDLMNGLSKSAGTCTIRFSFGEPSQANRSDFHAIIYTITGG